MRRFFISLAVMLACAASAHAQGVATFTYQRGMLHIQRAKPPSLPALPWQGADAPVQLAPSMFDLPVDIRPSTSLSRQEGWMSTTGIPANTGLLFIYEKPALAHVGALDYFQPLDVVWIDAQGLITAIAPSIVLAGRTEALVGEKPSKALLFLAGGASAAAGLAPGDRVVDSEYFLKPPELLTVPR